MARTGIERAEAQGGTLDDAGSPRPAVLLVALLGGAAAWTFHLLGSYVLIAWACSSGVNETAARVALAGVSAVALIAAGVVAFIARRRWRIAREIDRPLDDAWDARMGERTARASFLLVVGLVLAGVFAVGILYEGITVFLAPLCEPGVAR
ncbi:MAG: hypothetical protein ACREOK_12870 [Gemmatimonadaceae bacterium]